MLKFYAGESCNELKFGKLIRALYVKLNKMEQGKFIQPKFSESINDMLNGLQRSEIPTRLSTLDRMPTDSFLDLRQNAIRESRIEGDKGDST